MTLVGPARRARARGARARASLPRGLRARLRHWFTAPPAPQAELVDRAPAGSARTLLRRFWPFTAGLRRWLAVSLCLLALISLVEAAEVWLFKLVVDDVLVPRDFHRFLPIAAAYAGLSLTGGALAFADGVISTRSSQRFVLALRLHLFRHLQRLSLDFFDRRRLGDVLTRLTDDVSDIERFVLTGLTDTASYLLRLLVFAGLLFYLQWDLAAVTLVVAPVFWLAARHFARLLREVSRERRRRSGSVTAVAEESFANIALVQSYGREDWELERFRRQSLAKFEAEMASVRLRGLFRPLIDLLELTGTLAVIGLGAWELSRGTLSLGSLLAFLALVGSLFSPVRGLSRLGTSMSAASASAERIAEFLDQRPAVTDRPGAHPLRRARGAVAFETVTFGYPGAGRPALERVSLLVQPGETLALVGPSGSGKSTVAKLLLRFYDPHAGSIRLDGHDLRDITLQSLRSNIAVVLQETLIFDGSVRDNIAYGRPGATDDEVAAAAGAADAHGFVLALPEGYDTVLGERGRRLSGGQRQRIAIARALVRDAPVLILDEPAAGLDAESAQRIMDPLRRLMAGRTTVLVSHDLQAAATADRIAVLEHGRIVEVGTHAELVAAGRRYARWYAAATGPERPVPDAALPG